MTAKEIQKHLVEKYHDKEICLSNFYMGLWEADVFRLHDNGHYTEYEVKISRSDFFADFKKKRSKKLKHEEIQKGKRCNKFYFVVPEGLVKVEEVPVYCGLIYCTSVGLITKRRAKQIHTNQIDSKYYKQLSKKLYYKIKDNKLHLPK
jgi:hypothetical protein